MLQSTRLVRLVRLHVCHAMEYSVRFHYYEYSRIFFLLLPLILVLIFLLSNVLGTRLQ